MTGTRILTAILLVPVVLAVVWWGPAWLIATIVGGVTLIALYEFFRIAAGAALTGFRVWTMASAVLLVIGQYGAATFESWTAGGGFRIVRGQESGIEIVLIVFLVGVGLFVIWRAEPVAKALGAIGISAAGLLFVALPLSYVLRLWGIEWRGTGSAATGRGQMWVIFTLSIVWVGDSAAYFVGRWVGRNKLAPVLSPSKTWEGSIGNLLGSLAVALVFSRWSRVELAHLLAAAGLTSIAGQIGDLVESAYKRSAGVKDSGALLPGHGGMLDRIDALIFAAPVMWCYVSYVIER